MIVGLILNGDGRRSFSLVCSLTKELDRFYSNIAEIKTTSGSNEKITLSEQKLKIKK